LLRARRLTGIQGRERRVAAGFGRIKAAYAAPEQDRQDGKQNPSLPLASHHAAEAIRQRRPEREYEQRFGKVRERCRIFERVSGIGVEKSSAVTAQKFDRFLRGDRAASNDLSTALKRRHFDRRSQRLRHA